ncbi:hypothetical protein [Vagococcus xieshaowenii]|uniref:Uncharacterized protein n=1 Tax=Vagococcus xieshaowenii TaxID=2562451 RepID=A0AAJ5EGK7_9ENTE|nr:hypothetical protein [Vagococcus xieshaowenii]QCA29665.1 hypothetical protein E4Z98_09775 [Vagococcus xieshaowenii]TFZ42940.1 hypothetical protein E4031_01515 [Vagococcus xieshaowenii]
MTKLTDDQKEKLVKLYNQGFTAIELAEKFGITKGYVYLITSQYGVVKNKVVSQEDRKKIIKDYQNKEQIDSILSKYKISRRSLYRILDENNIPKRQGRNKKKN